MYWLVSGPGGGLLGQVPAVIMILLSGKYLFKMGTISQWGGTLRITRDVLIYRTLVGFALRIITFGLAWVTYSCELYLHFVLSQVMVNVFSNLYEEIISRGLLLQVIRDSFGDKVAIVSSSVLFGVMHGYGGERDIHCPHIVDDCLECLANTQPLDGMGRPSEF